MKKIAKKLVVFALVLAMTFAGNYGDMFFGQMKVVEAAQKVPYKVKGLYIVHKAGKKTLTIKWKRPTRGETFEVQMKWIKDGKVASIAKLTTSKRRTDTIKYKLGYTLKVNVRAKNKDGICGKWSKTAKYKCTRTNRKKSYHLSKDKMKDYEASSNEMSNKILEYINKDREKLGLKPYKMLKGLNLVAKKRSKEIAVSYSHVRPNKQSIWRLFEKYDVDTLDGYGENIMKGVDSAKDFYKAWYNSEGHYKNMMSKDYNSIGIYVYTDKNGKMYSSVIFSKK